MAQDISHEFQESRRSDKVGGGGKTEYSESMLQAIEARPARSTWRVSGDLGISWSSIIHHFHNLCKSIRSTRIVLPNVTKILQNLWLTLVVALEGTHRKKCLFHFCKQNWKASADYTFSWIVAYSTLLSKLSYQRNPLWQNLTEFDRITLLDILMFNFRDTVNQTHLQ